MLLLRYLAACLRYRDAAARRFLRGGLSIDERTRRLRAHWAAHHERSRAAQRRWEAAGGDLAVLGAGRLYDFETAALPPRFRRMFLFDADPSCEPAWRKQLADVQIEPRIGDLTGCLTRWQRALASNRTGWVETLRIAAGIVQPSVDRAIPLAADAVLSLNLLSQLPIAWQDMVEEHLTRRFGRARVKANETEWLAAVEPGGRWIVEQHLRALAASRAAHVLLITDIEYHDHEDRGARVVVQPALYDVPLELNGYTLHWQETWQWDISPLGAECDDYGSVHQVGAFAFSSSLRA